MDETQPTPLEIKLAAAGNKWLLAASTQVYEAMAAQLDEAGGMPQVLTERVIPLDPETLKDGRKFQRISTGRLRGNFLALVMGAIDAGQIDHLSQAEFDLLKPDPTGL